MGMQVNNCVNLIIPIRGIIYKSNNLSVSQGMHRTRALNLVYETHLKKKSVTAIKISYCKIHQSQIKLQGGSA